MSKRLSKGSFRLVYRVMDQPLLSTNFMIESMQKILFVLLLSLVSTVVNGCSGESGTTSTSKDAIQEYADANPAPPEVPLDGE
ncbi:hypothetical protein [Rhodopirellula baltica]|uniref:hypothetical protein n=1 Tax=Rhodopirellula baltica TaxID=265606 RepID=UPI001181B66B|nr:hypothetical protein [Rhodopirellula baltica]